MDLDTLIDLCSALREPAPAGIPLNLAAAASGLGRLLEVDDEEPEFDHGEKRHQPAHQALAAGRGGDVADAVLVRRELGEQTAQQDATRVAARDGDANPQHDGGAARGLSGLGHVRRQALRAADEVAEGA